METNMHVEKNRTIGERDEAGQIQLAKHCYVVV